MGKERIEDWSCGDGGETWRRERKREILGMCEEMRKVKKCERKREGKGVGNGLWEGRRDGEGKLFMEEEEER